MRHIWLSLWVTTTLASSARKAVIEILEVFTLSATCECRAFPESAPSKGFQLTCPDVGLRIDFEFLRNGTIMPTNQPEKMLSHIVADNIVGSERKAELVLATYSNDTKTCFDSLVRNFTNGNRNLQTAIYNTWTKCGLPLIIVRIRTSMSHLEGVNRNRSLITESSILNSLSCIYEATDMLSFKIGDLNFCDNPPLVSPITVMQGLPPGPKLVEVGVKRNTYDGMGNLGSSTNHDTRISKMFKRAIQQRNSDIPNFPDVLTLRENYQEGYTTKGLHGNHLIFNNSAFPGTVLTIRSTLVSSRSQFVVLFVTVENKERSLFSNAQISIRPDSRTLTVSGKNAQVVIFSPLAARGFCKTTEATIPQHSSLAIFLSDESSCTSTLETATVFAAAALFLNTRSLKRVYAFLSLCKVGDSMNTAFILFDFADSSTGDETIHDDETCCAPFKERLNFIKTAFTNGMLGRISFIFPIAEHLLRLSGYRLIPGADDDQVASKSFQISSNAPIVIPRDCVFQDCVFRKPATATSTAIVLTCHQDASTTNVTFDGLFPKPTPILQISNDGYDHSLNLSWMQAMDAGIIYWDNLVFGFFNSSFAHQNVLYFRVAIIYAADGDYQRFAVILAFLKGRFPRISVRQMDSVIERCFASEIQNLGYVLLEGRASRTIRYADIQDTDCLTLKSERDSFERKAVMKRNYQSKVSEPVWRG